MYYILNYTWGLLTTLLGWIAYGFVSVFMSKKILDKGKFGHAHYIMIGKGWGGFSLGTVFFIASEMGEYWTLHTKQHELGHTYQNAICGIFMPFLITIPSVIRYWYQTARAYRGKQNKPYEAIWFERLATEIGERVYNGKKPLQ